jgi:hypothetical protein
MVSTPSELGWQPFSRLNDGRLAVPRGTGAFLGGRLRGNLSCSVASTLAEEHSGQGFQLAASDTDVGRNTRPVVPFESNEAGHRELRPVAVGPGYRLLVGDAADLDKRRLEAHKPVNPIGARLLDDQRTAWTAGTTTEAQRSHKPAARRTKRWVVLNINGLLSAKAVLDGLCNEPPGQSRSTGGGGT